MSFLNISHLNMNALSQAQAQHADNHHLHLPPMSPDGIISDISDCGSESSGSGRGSGSSNTPLLTNIQEQIDSQKCDVDELVRMMEELREKIDLTEATTNALLGMASKIEAMSKSLASLNQTVSSLEGCITILDNRVIAIESSMASANRSTVDKIKEATYGIFQSLKARTTNFISLVLSKKVILIAGIICLAALSFRYIRR